jgi:hypothetical protein
MNFEYQTNLKSYPFLVKELDIIYGGPKFKQKRLPKGRKRLIQILKHLSIYKNSTCKDIAKIEWDNDLSTKVKLKSITDDIRKFINEKLIPKRLVITKEPKKIGNKKIKTYDLTIFGILYIIHMDCVNLENISRNYKEEHPLVFGRIDIFKKVFGKNYSEKIGIETISNLGIEKTYRFLDLDSILTIFNQVSSGAWIQGIAGIAMSHNTWNQQFSYAIYIHILSSLIIESISSIHRGNIESMQNKWQEIVPPKSEIDKWFKEFAKDALRANKKQVKQLKILNDFLKQKEPTLAKTYQ